MLNVWFKLMKVMSAERDDMVLRRALENGAYMVLEKPFFVETIKYLWQHVMREKISNEASKDSDESVESEGSKGKSPQDDIENKIRNRKKTARDRRKGKNKEGFDQFDNNSRVKKRTCTEWTEELHQKFVDAVLMLGEGSMYYIYIYLSKQFLLFFRCVYIREYFILE